MGPVNTGSILYLLQLRHELSLLFANQITRLNDLSLIVEKSGSIEKLNYCKYMCIFEEYTYEYVKLLDNVKWREARKVFKVFDRNMQI